MKTHINYKTLVLIPMIGLTLNSCKTFYANTFVSTKNNKVLVKDDETSEERLVDCSKKSSDYKQLLSDLPYFKEGDPVKLQTKQRYDGFRVFQIEESKLKYNKDSIQIRKDREKILEYKNQNQR